MKKRLTGKKAGIAILSVLFILSIADTILRGVVFEFEMLNLSNVGEPFVTAIISLVLIFFALKGKDRIFYIVCGGFLGYFVLNQLFGLPAMVTSLINSLPSEEGQYIQVVAIVFHLLSMLGIISIGILLVEYLNDGTIFNKAFNIVCLFTVLMLTSALTSSLFPLIVRGSVQLTPAVFNHLTRLTMVFLFSFFAYDSAKDQLLKVKD